MVLFFGFILGGGIQNNFIPSSCLTFFKSFHGNSYVLFSARVTGGVFCIKCDLFCRRAISAIIFHSGRQMNITDLALQTSLMHRRNPPLVFTTAKTLHERFTPQDNSCVFIVKCGYIPPSAFSPAREHVEFASRRCINANERYSSYRRGNFRRMENRKRLEQELQLMAKKRRTVEMSTTSTEKSFDRAVGSSKSEKKYAVSVLNRKSPMHSICSTSPSQITNYVEKFSQINLNSGKYYDSGSSEGSFFDSQGANSKFYNKFRGFTEPNPNKPSGNLYCSTPYRSRRCDRFGYIAKKDDNIGEIAGSYDAIGYYSIPGQSVLCRRASDNQYKKNARTMNYSHPFNFPETYEYLNRKIPKFGFSPYRYYAEREALNRLRRRPVTKEELDDDLDRYMAEVKLKVSATDDVDPFVEEYMLETAKCLNQQDCMDTLN